jgi:2-polyprenyl-3-methyl-5-hydroxy-6-metoxy-1,4-benzoquinol methylase
LSFKIDQKTFSDNKYKTSNERIQPFKLKLLGMCARNHKKGLVLDIGCGTGIISKKMNAEGLQPIGLDISEFALIKYHKRNLKGIIADLESCIPFDDGLFDKIWISEVIEHVRNYENLISEIYRVLKPGGILYLTTPNSQFYVYRFFYLIGKTADQLQHQQHVNFFNYGVIVNKIKEKKFNIERIFGQNIYGVIPARVVNKIYQCNRLIGRSIEKALFYLGFRYAKGFIHGDKYMLFRFSNRLNSFFSNTIMLIAKKPSKQ